MCKKLLSIFYPLLLVFIPLNVWGNSADLFSLDSDVTSPIATPTPFKAEGFFDEQKGIAHFEITAKQGAYIYKDSININGDPACKASLIPLPSGIQHQDLNSTQEVYFEKIALDVAVIKSIAGSFIKLSYRGCDENGICYPPQECSLSLPAFNAQNADVDTKSSESEQSSVQPSSVQPSSVQPSSVQQASDQQDSNQHIAALLTQKNNEETINATSTSDDATSNIATPSKAGHDEAIDEFFLQGGMIATLLLFVLLGASLDLTPCVLPLLGIFSAMILGNRALSLKKSLALNFAYLCGLVCVYTILGWIFANLGMQAHAFLSSPIFTLVTGAVFIILAADCLGLINLKPPKLLNDKIQQRLSTQSRGKISSALIFGAFSGLLTTPCTSAPLAGALLYIAKEGDVLNGTLMFASIGLGMGIPLCLIGLFGSKFLPKGGAFASVIRRIIAVPLLFAAFVVMQALWDYNRTVQIVVTGLLMMLTVFILSTASVRIPKKMALISALLYGLSVSFCATQVIKEPNVLPFQEISSLNKLKQFSGKTVYLSFSASWCGNCHVLDEKVYSQDSFKESLHAENLTALRFDLSDPKRSDAQAMASNYLISGVPVALIIQDGHVLRRLDGYHDLKEVLDFMHSSDRLNSPDHNSSNHN